MVCQITELWRMALFLENIASYILGCLLSYQMYACLTNCSNKSNVIISDI